MFAKAKAAWVGARAVEVPMALKVNLFPFSSPLPQPAATLWEGNHRAGTCSAIAFAIAGTLHGKKVKENTFLAKEHFLYPFESCLKPNV